MNSKRDDRDGGGRGGLAVLVVAGILVVMLLAIGGGAGYWYLQVQRGRIAERVDLALMEAELEAEAAAKAALSSAEAALNSSAVEAADTANRAPRAGGGRRGGCGNGEWKG